MQNLSTFHRHDIQEHDKINIPGGLGLVNYIDVRDVAEAIVTILMNPGHEHQAYDITGPEALDFYQIARIFSTELGREIKYTRPSAIKFVRQKLLDKKQMLYVLTLSLLYNAARSGKMNYANDVFWNITGHDPRNITDFIHDYRDCWLKTEPKIEPTKNKLTYRSKK
jgi:nucleoside-diphosphate-sugar epimerase